MSRFAGRWICFGFAVLFLVALFSGEIRDTDIWWHLKTGERILATRTVSLPDAFSYTAQTPERYAGESDTRHFNLTHEWLAETVMYLIYSVAGIAGLVLSRAALLVLFCALVSWIVWKRTEDFLRSVAAGLAAAGMSFYFQQSRPFLVTFVCVAATMAMLDSGRYLWALPPMFLVWANCHGGFFLGWLVLGAYCCDALIRRTSAKRLFVVSAVSIVLSGLNPNGFRVLQILWNYRLSQIQLNNLEWQRPKFWEPGIYSFLLFGSLIALVWAYRRARAVDCLLYLGFAALSLMAIRNTIFLGVIGPIVLATYLPKKHGISAISTMVAFVFLIASDFVPPAKSSNVLALRAADWQLPSRAADYLAMHHVTARMFNSYEEGGYLIWRLWPLERVFIDSRGLSEQAFTDYRSILYGSGEQAEMVFRKYGVEVIALDGFDYLSGQVFPFLVDLASSTRTDWKLVYADSVSVVFTRHPSDGMQPMSAAPVALRTSLENQCDQHLRNDPIHPRCAFGLAELYAHDGNLEQARRWMDFYLERKTGPDAEATRIDQSLKVTALNNDALGVQAKGDLVQAESLFRLAVTTAEKNLGPNDQDTAGSLNNLAALLEEKGDVAGAELAYRRALEICESTLGANDPHTAMALDNLAGLLESKGDFDSAQPLYRRALAIAEKSMGPNAPEVQAIRDALARDSAAQRNSSKPR